MNKNILLLSSWLLTCPALAAIEINDYLSVSGFGSTSWAKSDNETQLLINRYIDDSSCFDCDTTLGVQLDFYYESFKASAQIVKRPQDSWDDPELEWAYIGYEWDDFEFRAGRLRLPLFLKSEYFYVGHAYTYARPPTEVYNSTLGITSFDGLSAIWYTDVTDSLSLSLTPYVGFKKDNEARFDDTFRLELETQNLWGVNALFTGDNYRLNLTYLDSTYESTAILTPPPPFYTPEPDRQNVKLYGAGIEYDWKQAIFTLEAQKNEERASWYTAVEYNIDKFTPYAVFGQQYTDDKKSGNSFALGARYDVLSNVSINAEWQRFKAHNGYIGAFSTPRGPVSEPEANLYTIMLNFVF